MDHRGHGDLGEPLSLDHRLLGSGRDDHARGHRVWYCGDCRHWALDDASSEPAETCRVNCQGPATRRPLVTFECVRRVVMRRTNFLVVFTLALMAGVPVVA